MNDVNPEHHNAEVGRADRSIAYRGAKQRVRPTFKEWLHATWLDIVTLMLMGAMGMVAYKLPPMFTRLFPVYFRDGDVVYPQFAYPLRREIMPIWLNALLTILIPVVIILLLQIRVRSFWDVNNAFFGLSYSLVTAAVFQSILKWLIGGLRPHFLGVCKPSIPTLNTNSGQGLDGIMYDRSVCTGDAWQVEDSLESFPSGHTTAGFASLVFLSLYLNAKLKVWTDRHPSYWKMVATLLPLLGATIIGGVLTIDEYHNWYDILAGAVIGTFMALSSYRMVYASIWNFRTNHVPIKRACSSENGDNQMSVGEIQ